MDEENDLGIEFEQDFKQSDIAITSRLHKKQRMSMPAVLVEYGIAPNETIANYMLIGLTLVLFVVTFVMLFSTLTPKPFPPAETFYSLTPPSGSR